MFEKPFNLIVYGVTLLLLALGVLLHTNLTVIAAVAVFIFWDTAFLGSRLSMHGRTIKEALQQTHNIREHISYFLAFYGVLFAILFTQSAADQSQFLDVCRDAGISIPLLVLPFVLATIPILFVPIQVAKTDADEPSSSLKALVSLSALFQKVSIFLFVHVVLRILEVLARPIP